MQDTKNYLNINIVNLLSFYYLCRMRNNELQPAGLKVTEDAFFRPGAGNAWEKTVFFTNDEILAPETTIFRQRFFNIHILEKTPVSLKGKIVFEEGELKFDAGEFTLDREHPVYCTKYLNVAYDTHLRLSLEWIMEAHANAIKAAIDMADQHDAMVPRPATDEDLEICNTELRDSDFPEIPEDYAGFLKVCMGFAFNGVELYGPDNITDRETGFTLMDIIEATEDFNEHYVDEGYIDIDYPLLCFGRQNGDYFTYDPQTCKYQLRDHEDACNTVWGEYDTFEEFFMAEVAGYSGLVAQAEETGSGPE